MGAQQVFEALHPEGLLQDAPDGEPELRRETRRRGEHPAVEAAHQDDRRVAARLREHAQHLDPVGALHREVEDDHVGAARERPADLLRVVERDGVEAHRAPHPGDERADHGLVVDDQ
jgi:hypothetical protein